MDSGTSEPTSTSPLPGIKRGRGRPPGSRNKVGKSVKQLLDLHGKGSVEFLCALAAGHVVYGAVGADGERERLNPTVAERLQAAKIVVDKLVPTLKMSEAEITSSVTVSGDAFPNHHPGDLAKAMLGVLNAGRPPQATLPTLSVEAPLAMPTPDPIPEPQASIPAPVPEPEPEPERELLPSEADGPVAARLRVIGRRDTSLGDALGYHINRAARAFP
jgi:hypothetical protein